MKPVISWGEVEGATKYVIYRSTSKSKGYKVIGENETLTYEDLTAKKGKTYYYKVVAVGEGFQSAQSAYVKIKSK
jgi:fibronectin type 3 domain-containing protein